MENNSKISRLKNDKEVPPFFYLSHLLDTYPKAGSLYLSLWNKKDRNSKVIVDRERINNEFMMNTQKFNHDRMCLEKIGLVSTEEHEDPDGEKFMILELTEWDEEVC